MERMGLMVQSCVLKHPEGGGELRGLPYGPDLTRAKKNRSWKEGISVRTERQ